MKMLKKTMTILALVLTSLLITETLYARGGFSGGRSGGFRSSPSRSYSRPSPSRSSGSSRSSRSSGYGTSRSSSKKATVTKRAPTKAEVARQKAKVQKTVDRQQAKTDAAKFKKLDTKSPAYQKTDKMLTQNIGKSGKTFKTRSTAETSIRSKMAEKQKSYSYKDSKTAMANRPDYVPQTFRGSGGVVYQTTFMPGMGYGYMSPTGFIAYTAANMMITDAMLYSYGYRPYVRPAYHPLTGTGILIWIGGLLFLVFIYVSLVSLFSS